jgi:hypothetical protein
MAATEDMLELILQCPLLPESYIRAPLVDIVILSNLLFFYKCTSLSRTFQIIMLSVSEEALFVKNLVEIAKYFMMRFCKNLINLTPMQNTLISSNKQCPCIMFRICLYARRNILT